MTNEIRTSIALSLLFHAGIFLFFSLHAKRPDFILLPVELMFSNPPSAPVVSPAVPAPHAPLTTPQEKDVIVPKKEKAEPQKNVRKETVQDAKKGREENRVPGPDSARPSGPSSPLSVDASRFPYAYYLNIVSKKINRNWNWSAEYGSLRVEVRFRIQRNGEISGVNIKKPSRDRVFDDMATRAVLLASPFPPLPDGFQENDLGVTFEFKDEK